MREDLMVQQQVENLWQHFVGVICLNQTYRKQVKEVLPKLFKKYCSLIIIAAVRESFSLNCASQYSS